MESATPYTITNAVVPKRDVRARNEAQGTDKAMAGPSKHPLKAVPMMGTTIAMIYHVTMDLE